MSLPNPYYQSADGTITIYCGDCLDILPELPSGSVDAVVTDTPYGIGFDYDEYDDSLENWERTINQLIPEAKRVARFVVMPCCQIKNLVWWYTNHQPEWMIAWYKGSPGHRSSIGFNDWEPHLVWGKPPSPMHDYFQTVCGFDDNGHPCPKPVPWALWLVRRVAIEGGTILDPFLGSGTTAVACIKTGRRCIGIELSEAYCAIAARRCEEAFDSQALFRQQDATA